MTPKQDDSAGSERIKKSTGVTASEKVLAHLCEASFLRLWSYPNVFRAQNRELCDVLVVFGRHVLLFSDKSCGFPCSGDLTADWSRWYSRAIGASAQQLRRASKWLEKGPRHLFLDAKCERPFPIALPLSSDMVIHRIVVANGAASECRKHMGGSGSLLLAPASAGNEPPPPFVVSGIDSSGVVHILNEATLSLVLGELDTISDFVEYLARKEALVRSGMLAVAAGEENLLAAYVEHLTEDGQHGFPNAEGQGLAIDAGLWARLISRPEYKAREVANRPSRLWDLMIDEFAKHIAEGTSLQSGQRTVSEAEQGIRVLASESRLGRRFLGQALLELLESATAVEPRVRVASSPKFGRVRYVFVVGGAARFEDYEEHRRSRLQIMEAYAKVVKFLDQEVERIVAIGTEPFGSSPSSEDMFLMDTSEWTAVEHKEGQRLHEAGLLRNMKVSAGRAYEFPEVNAPASKTDRG